MAEIMRRNDKILFSFLLIVGIFVIGMATWGTVWLGLAFILAAIALTWWDLNMIDYRAVDNVSTATKWETEFGTLRPNDVSTTNNVSKHG